GGFDFAQETLGAECGAQVGMQHLDGDLAVVPKIAGQVHRRHAALTQLPLDAVAVGQCSGEPGLGIAHAVPRLAGKTTVGGMPPNVPAGGAKAPPAAAELAEDRATWHIQYY